MLQSVRNRVAKGVALFNPEQAISINNGKHGWRISSTLPVAVARHRNGAVAIVVKGAEEAILWRTRVLWRRNECWIV